MQIPSSLLPAAVVLLFSAAVAGCGGDDGAACGGTTPCGGEIAAGRYKIASFCATSGPVMLEGCDAPASVDLSGLSITGTLTFDAAKTYRAETMTGGSMVQVIPAQCLARGSVQVTCAQVNQALQSSLASNDAFESVSCSGSGACTCRLTFKTQPQMVTGTYATRGTTVTFTPEGGPGTPNAYCATGSQITVESSPMTGMMGMMGMEGLVDGKSSMVLTRE